MAVMMVMFPVFDHRDYTSVGGLAERVLELDRRVIDTKITE